MKLITDEKLLEQLNAPQAVTDPALLAQLNAGPPSPQMTLRDAGEDVARSAGGGLVQGTAAVLGRGGDLNNMLSGVVKHVGDNEKNINTLLATSGAGEQVDVAKAKSVIKSYMPWMRSTDERHIGSPEITKKLAGVPFLPDPYYEPKTLLGNVAKTVGAFTPDAVMPGGGGFIRGALGAGTGSELAGQAVRSDTGKEGSWQETVARIVGGVGGGLTPNALRRAGTPLPTSPSRTQAVDLLKKEGVTDITAGQATNRPWLRYLEAERGRGGDLEQSALRQYTTAASRRIGENTPELTPEVMRGAYKRMGGTMDDLAATYPAKIDVVAKKELADALTEYKGLVNAPNRAPVIDRYVKEIAAAAKKNKGTLPGDVYQSLRSRMERSARSMGSNPEAQSAVRDIRAALDNAVERKIAAVNPADAGKWKEVRGQYRNALALSHALTGAGGESIVKPNMLRAAAKAQEGARNYSMAKGPFDELARAGEQVLKPLPNSGTAGRLSAQSLGMSAGGGALGAGVGFLGGGPVGAGAGLAAGATALPTAVGHLATSKAGRAYLGNQKWLPNGKSYTTQNLLADVLLEQQLQNLNSQR